MADPDVELDSDLDTMDAAALRDEVKRLRAGIREHRDSTGHELCWFHPALWELLPETAAVDVVVPDWPQFLRGCVAYRTSLDEQLPAAPRSRAEFDRRS